MDYYDSEYLRSKCELEEEDEIPMRISEAYDSYERLVLRARSGSRVHLSQFVDMAEHLKDRIESYKSRTAPKGKDPVRNDRKNLAALRRLLASRKRS